MAAIENVRPIDGMNTPLKVRMELRYAFARWFSTPAPTYPYYQRDEIVDAMSLLDLCRYYRLEYPGGCADVSKAWDESDQRIEDGGPTFEELQRAGWVFFDGGRWCMQRPPDGVSSFIAYPSPNTKSFLTGLGKIRIVARTEAPPPHTREFAAKIAAENWLESQIPTKHAQWIAGRLWEYLCPKPPRCAAGTGNEDCAPEPDMTESDDSSDFANIDEGAVDQAFLEWSAWCAVLGDGVKWDVSWNSAEALCCREAAKRALSRQMLWGDWDTDLLRYTEVLKNTFAIPLDQLRYAQLRPEAPPETLVSRASWLGWPEVEHLTMNRIGTSTVSFALGLLCSELENTDIGPDLAARAKTVIDFAAGYPMALQQFLYRVNSVPMLLVDLLLHQRAACLAVKLAVEWRAEGTRLSDRDVKRNAQAEEYALQDSLSLIAYNFGDGLLDLEECASLITWCHSSAIHGSTAFADSRRSIGRQLVKLVADSPMESQSEVLRFLLEQAAYKNNLPRARFAAALDGLNYLSKAHGVEEGPIVALYTKFAREMHLDWTDASSLQPELAARLVFSALSQNEAECDAFLTPFDSVRLLRQASGDDQHSLRSSVAATLRVHVRLLARAVAGWTKGTVPGKLCEALQTHISRSVIEHTEKGRVGALTDSYSPIFILNRVDGSPAADLSAAWRRLDKYYQESMLTALAQSDDPVLLAELCLKLPAAAKAKMQDRLRQLSPSEASSLWTWPHLQKRIESLLSAREYALAREHMGQAQPNLQQAPQQYRLNFFGLELQLLLREANWDALDRSVIPAGLNQDADRQARDLLQFYVATSQLLRPNGNLVAARAVMERLGNLAGSASVYKENFFAIAIQQLVGQTISPLAGAELDAGNVLLADIDAAIADDPTLARTNLLTNRALLLLALNRPEDALDSVALRRREERTPELEFVAVLSKAQMGLSADAMATLKAAVEEYGNDERFTALKNDLLAEVALPSLATPAVSVDAISSIRAALQQLCELLPDQIGDILGPVGSGMRGYLMRQVSRAIASLQHMTAILQKNIKDETQYEDDLNTAVREVLGAMLAFVGWDVADQSLGGTTAVGNPGERDAVIRVSGQELAIYEAQVCFSLNRTTIRAHFKKLFSYGNCDTYFHVVYSYADAVQPLMDYARKMLKDEVPAGVTFLSLETLGPPSYETSGYLATYRVDHRDVAVVFFLVDLLVRKSHVAPKPKKRNSRSPKQK